MSPRIEPYRHHIPLLDPSAWIDDSVIIIGEVVVAAQVSLWPGVILRGDQGAIRVGEGTNLQDGTIVHATGGRSETVVGARCTVGHRVLLHGCQIEDDCLIGMGAIVMDNAHIGRHSIIGAGALVAAGKHIPPRSMVMGVPGRVVRTVTEAEIESLIQHGYEEYLRLAAERQR